MHPRQRKLTGIRARHTPDAEQVGNEVHASICWVLEHHPRLDEPPAQMELEEYEGCQSLQLRHVWCNLVLLAKHPAQQCQDGHIGYSPDRIEVRKPALANAEVLRTRQEVE